MTAIETTGTASAAATGRASPEPARETSNEILISEAIALALILERLARSSYGVAEDRLLKLRTELSVLAVRHDPTALRYEANRRARLELLIEEARAAISKAYADIARQVERDLMQAGELAQDSLSQTLALLLLVKGLSRRLDRTELVRARDETMMDGVSVRDWIARQSGNLQFRAAAALENAMRQTVVGETAKTADLIDALRSTAVGGLFSAAPGYLKNLIRGAFHAVANMVRFETARRHPELFRAYQHLSILDNRTSDICRSRANRLWRLDGTPIGHRLPFALAPLHYACRSHIVPVTLPYSDLPSRIRKRVRPSIFTGVAAREPSLDRWLADRGQERDPGPIDYPAARRFLGLEPD